MAREENGFIKIEYFLTLSNNSPSPQQHSSGAAVYSTPLSKQSFPESLLTRQASRQSYVRAIQHTLFPAGGAATRHIVWQKIARIQTVATGGKCEPAPRLPARSQQQCFREEEGGVRRKFFASGV